MFRVAVAIACFLLVMTAVAYWGGA